MPNKSNGILIGFIAFVVIAAALAYTTNNFRIDTQKKVTESIRGIKDAWPEVEKKLEGAQEKVVMGTPGVEKPVTLEQKDQKDSGEKRDNLLWMSNAEGLFSFDLSTKKFSEVIDIADNEIIDQIDEHHWLLIESKQYDNRPSFFLYKISILDVRDGSSEELITTPTSIRSAYLDHSKKTLYITLEDPERRAKDPDSESSYDILYSVSLADPSLKLLAPLPDSGPYSAYSIAGETSAGNVVIAWQAGDGGGSAIEYLRMEGDKTFTPLAKYYSHAEELELSEDIEHVLISKSYPFSYLTITRYPHPEEKYKYIDETVLLYDEKDKGKKIFRDQPLLLQPEQEVFITSLDWDGTQLVYTRVSEMTQRNDLYYFADIHQPQVASVGNDMSFECHEACRNLTTKIRQDHIFVLERSENSENSVLYFFPLDQLSVVTSVPFSFSTEGVVLY